MEAGLSPAFLWVSGTPWQMSWRTYTVYDLSFFKHVSRQIFSIHLFHSVTSSWPVPLNGFPWFCAPYKWSLLVFMSSDTQSHHFGQGRSQGDKKGVHLKILLIELINFLIIGVSLIWTNGSLDQSWILCCLMIHSTITLFRPVHWQLLLQQWIRLSPQSSDWNYKDENKYDRELI